MIVTKQKDLKEIKQYIKKYKTFFLIGCSECASLCGTGDEKAILNLRDWLESQNKKVTGWMITKAGCQILGTKRELTQYKESLDQTQCILVLSCGAGVQTITEFFEEKSVIPVNDTLFIGNMRRFREFEEKCRACGECLLAITGICVVTLCPKQMLNGPCGGYRGDRCEINNERKCAWIIAYRILEKRGIVDKFYKNILGPKNWLKADSPRQYSVRKKLDST